MATAVAALAAAMLLLTFSTLDTDIELPGSGELSDSVHHSAAEQVLRGVLTWQRTDQQEAAFHRHRALAEQFVGAAASHLRHISPLFAGAVVEHAGGAYEDTRVSNAADFDMYTVIDAVPLRQFELQRGEDGNFAVRLLPGAARADLPEDLIEMMTEDGYLDAHRFKQWTVECVIFALLTAAEARPELHPLVYATRGAPGVNLTAADGATVEIDFPAKLPLPPTQERLLRPAALRPCGTVVPPPGDQPSWHLYSSPISDTPDPAAAERRRFSADAAALELNLLRKAPLLRDVTRLLKTLHVTHDWHHRFHVMSFHLKQAAFWWWEDGCEQRGGRQETGLLPATVAALRRLEHALRSGRLEDFWFAAPAANELDRRILAPQLADEVAGCVKTLTSGDTQRIRRLFRY